MKKIIFTITVLFAFAVNAFAIPYTWVDTKDFNPNNQYIDFFHPATYTHDITDNGFTVGVDTIDNYTLTFKLYDTASKKYCSNINIAFIDQPGGLTADKFYAFNINLDKSLNGSIEGIYKLNSTGKLDVTIYAILGDFFLDYSQLTANGTDAAPVPEPGTMVLLGFGMLGLAIYGKRRMNKEA
jgi:hypothetical protein